MNFHEIVIGEIQSDGSLKVLKLLAETHSKPVALHRTLTVNLKLVDSAGPLSERKYFAPVNEGFGMLSYSATYSEPVKKRRIFSLPSPSTSSSLNGTVAYR